MGNTLFILKKSHGYNLTDTYEKLTLVAEKAGLYILFGSRDFDDEDGKESINGNLLETPLENIAFPFNIDTFFTIIEPKFSISPTTSPTKKC